MSDVIFEVPETESDVGMRVVVVPASCIDVELSDTGTRDIRLLNEGQTAELRDALIRHTLGEEVAARVQAAE